MKYKTKISDISHNDKRLILRNKRLIKHDIVRYFTLPKIINNNIRKEIRCPFKKNFYENRGNFTISVNFGKKSLMVL